MTTETHDAVRGFVPGVILAERYRIIARVGRGGMGEVFRADDLRLGQPVALKFLPPELERDEVALARLLAEVRLARTIAHPNVCRVHDIGDLPASGDAPARTFLSMEYIDGEDLASLLRRIGRLPISKALDVARQLCAGLAAAHDKGVLHRDLKPANVMIDGRGHARIADFGIAVQASVAANDESAEDNAGTLAYMAPERLAGAPATVQSDLYALGLILYETVTGAPPFSGETPLEWMKAHAVSQPSDPSAVVRDIDPAMERAILRCLEKDPAKRPKSAAEVAASLPGGDPLAAALAAGETPSPEMVAASGDDGVLSRAKAWSWFVVALLSIAASLWLTAPSLLINNTSLPLSTDALERRGSEIAVALGYSTPPADRASRWMTDSTVPSGVDSAPRRRVRFQYRQASAALLAPPPMNVIEVGARSQDDFTIVMDPHGRLRSLDVGGVNPYSDTTGARATNWAPLLDAIGADVAPVPSAKRRWPAAYFGDTRAAWTATVDGVSSDIEAASLRGRAVSLRIRPVNAPDALVAPPNPTSPVYLQIILAAFVAVPFLLAFLARRNVRLGRGDRRGAMRLAVVTFLLLSVYSVSVLHWAGGPIAANAMLTVVLAMAIPLVVATVIWFDYLAIEPFVRRHWPHLMVSWARLLEGRWRDGFVGQSILAGVTVQTAMASLALLLERLLRAPASAPYTYFGGWWEPALIFESVGEGLGLTMVFVGVLVLARIVFRRDLAAWITLFGLVWIGNVLAPFSWVGVAFGFAVALLSVGVLRQFGLLAFFVTILVDLLLVRGPFTLDPSRWHFTAGLIGPAVLVALAVLGFLNVLGKQSLLPSEAFDG